MLGRRNEFVHQIVMTYRLEPFLRDVIFMIFWQSRFQTISRGFMGLHDAPMLCLLDFVGFVTLASGIP